MAGRGQLRYRKNPAQISTNRNPASAARIKGVRRWGGRAGGGSGRGGGGGAATGGGGAAGGEAVPGMVMVGVPRRAPHFSQKSESIAFGLPH